MTLKNSRIVLLGGGSLVGHHLIPMLAELGCRGYVVSQSPVMGYPNFTGVSKHELLPAQAGDGAVVVSLWPIWLAAPVLRSFPRASQFIVLSSTSIFGKSKSTDPSEHVLVEKLIKAEMEVRSNATVLDIPYTILRPTLIYDGKRDRSITTIARVIRRVGLFAVDGSALGLRQPIHAQDVAQAIVGAMGNNEALNKSLNIAGGEILTYRDMVRRVAESTGRRVFIVSCPKPLLKGALSLLRLLKLTDLSPSLFDRMNQNLVYDGREAEEILQFQPRRFEPWGIDAKHSSAG